MRQHRIRLAFVVALASLTGACGFHPLYGSTDSHSVERRVFADIYVDPIAGERIGYELRNSLINSLQGAARPEDAVYRLTVTENQYIQSIAVANNSAVTRYNYTLNAHYDLSDIKTGKIIKSGAENTLSAYDVVTSPYATEVAQQDAQKRGAEDVAYRIQIDLAVFFAKHLAPTK
jgi:LPS-assembly lipoprotein